MKVLGAIALAAFVGGSTTHGRSLVEPNGDGSWNPKKAAAYLDRRQAWWRTWPVATRDHETFCVSCHTNVPYVLARPALRVALGEDGRSMEERSLLDNVITRVRSWKEVQPFYGGAGTGASKAGESRGTEAVLNALMLTSYASGEDKLSDDTITALDNMWSLQVRSGNLKGAWQWLQFGNEPFEAADSDYYGAALAAVAVGNAGEVYRTSPNIRDNLRLLEDYLNREYDNQSSLNQLAMLWASAKWPGLVTPERRNAVVQRIINLQGADGGWSLPSVAWTWRSWTVPGLIKSFTESYGTRLKGISDGYATAFITFVLEQIPLRRDDAHLARAREWLIRNQDKTKGLWQSYSLNNQRDPYSGTGLFMSDAATAYAVLALTGWER